MPLHDEPTNVELAAIEGEWPLIAADLALVEAECRMAASGPGDALAERARRRALHGVLSALVQQLNHDGPVVVRLAPIGTTTDSAAVA